LIIAAIVYFSAHGADFIKDIQSFSMLGPNPSPDQAMAAMSILIGPMLWIYLPTLLAAIVTFIFNVLDGTSGPNRFGPDPKGRGSETNIF